MIILPEFQWLENARDQYGIQIEDAKLPAALLAASRYRRAKVTILL
jgi:hypothetical protein